MKTQTNSGTNGVVIERLTALWALNECGLGGFMHAFNSPFTGIIVGGISVLLVSLIALHSEKAWPIILKSLGLVLLVKATVSPHSPIPAYFAVSFQALLGALMYSIFSVNLFSVVLVSMVTFLESALQKLLTLTIVYGQSLWNSLDAYGKWVVAKFPSIPFDISSTTVIYLYVGTYGLAGFLLGLFIFNVIRRIKDYHPTSRFGEIVGELDEFQSGKGQKGRLKKTLYLWLLTIIIILIPLWFTDMYNYEIQKGLYIVIRSFIIIMLWYTVIGPFALKIINRYILKQKSAFQKDLEQTLISFPYLRQLIRIAWSESKSFRGYHKLLNFAVSSIVYCINFRIPRS